MPDKQSPMYRAAVQYNDDKQKLAALMANDMGQAMGTSPVTPDQERMLFWQRDPSLTDQHLELVHQLELKQATDEGLSPEQAADRAMVRKAIGEWPYPDEAQVGRPVFKGMFPTRMAVVTQGDRHDDPDKQQAFVKRMVEQGPPEEPA